MDNNKPKIDGNARLQEALDPNLCKDIQTCRAYEDEFIQMVNENYKDHCSCKEPCRWHGKCRECILLHRGHRDHLPFCLHSMVGERVKCLVDIIEGNIEDNK